jgi:hypothetical protein
MYVPFFQMLLKVKSCELNLNLEPERLRLNPFAILFFSNAIFSIYSIFGGFCSLRQLTCRSSPIRDFSTLASNIEKKYRFKIV